MYRKSPVVNIPSDVILANDMHDHSPDSGKLKGGDDNNPTTAVDNSILSGDAYVASKNYGLNNDNQISAALDNDKSLQAKQTVNEEGNKKNVTNTHFKV